MIVILEGLGIGNKECVKKKMTNNDEKIHPQDVQ